MRAVKSDGSYAKNAIPKTIVLKKYWPRNLMGWFKNITIVLMAVCNQRKSRQLKW